MANKTNKNNNIKLFIKKRVSKQVQRTTLQTIKTVGAIVGAMRIVATMLK
ncbi:hypothetical protein [Rhodoferax sp.]|nr:hypothetical protein [Rhodoferax sp.]MDD2809609.1 hypothetical protein [Rhodoferax sp.]